MKRETFLFVAVNRREFCSTSFRQFLPNHHQFFAEFAPGNLAANEKTSEKSSKNQKVKERSFVPKEQKETKIVAFFKKNLKEWLI